MPVLLRLLEGLRTSVLQASWAFLFALFLAHMLSSWLLVALAGEGAIKAPEIWVYFYIVTATTVGYGDFSPETLLGRWVVALWVVPGGIALFAALIGKTTAILVDFWRRGMRGRGDYSHLANHTVVLGYHGEATEMMVDKLLEDDATRQGAIVLCVIKDIENPMPDKVKFVRGDSFAQASLLRRAGVSTASRVLIYAESDEQALATAFSVEALDPLGHVVVHCEAEDSAALLKAHFPRIECTQGLAIEMLVRSAQDPGVSRIVNELLSVSRGPTQYRMQLPDHVATQPFGELMAHFKYKHNATLLGIARDLDGQGFELNPPVDASVAGGDVLYYMAARRIAPEMVNWAVAREVA